MDLKQAISIIDGGAWVSLRFITADVNKGSGGKVIELAKARICRNRSSSPLSLERGVGGEAAFSSPHSGGREASSPFGVRAPNHHLHFTRNLELPNKQIRKVHPILITHLNQEAIV